jgi:YidC/Oxa1 family membrane protein insertase
MQTMFLHNPIIDILYAPFLNALVLLYHYLPGHDFGIAVIALTVLIRLLLYPLMAQAIRAQKVMTELQPKIQEIQERFKNDREKQAKETMALYQKEKINPLGGCLPLLIQMPILIALFRVFWEGLRPEEMTNLYSFVPHPGIINPTFLGAIDLSKSFMSEVSGQTEYYWPVFILAILAGLCQFIQTKMVSPKIKKNQGSDQMAKFSGIMQKQMVYFFPLLMVFILLRLPAAIGLYWLVTSLFSIGQQYLVFAKQPPASST